jgi:predicted deacylase
MRVGDIEARPGTKAFGYLKTGAGRSGLCPDIPVHVIAGRESGPTLLVQAAVHGTEIISTVAILRFVKRVDPAKIRGAVIAVPVVNRLGFELSDRVNTMDGKDISRLFPGKPRGSISDQIAHAYFHEVVRRANVMLEFHAGGLAGYERYVLFTADADPGAPTEIEQKRHKLVVAFGLEVAAFFPPTTFGTNASEEAIADAGVVMFQPELGGGTGWFANGDANVRDAERGIWNTMKAMRMIDGPMDADGPLCKIYNASVVLWKPPADGLFIRKKGFDELVRAGEAYGTLQDPYTGRTLAEMRSTSEATVIPSGREWPIAGTTSIGILGHVDRVVDRRTADLYVSFD